MKVQRFSKGSVILNKGSTGDAFYILRSGHVRTFLERSAGEDIAIEQLGPTEGFGEMSILTDQPRPTTVVAITDVAAWRLPKEEFESVLSENLSMSLYFTRTFAQRLQMLHRRVDPYL